MKYKIYSLILLINFYASAENHAKYLQKFKQKSAQETKSICSFTTNAIKLLFRGAYNKDNPYKNTPAQVRCSSNLCEQEIATMSKRMKVAHANLEKFLGRTIDKEKLPKIAICCSGGGYRAMISTLGLLDGLSDIGLNDSIAYASTLSGSTWALATWTHLACNLKDLKEQISNNISTNPKIGKYGIIPPITNLEQIRKIVKRVTNEYLFDQPLEAIDIWGSLIINNLLHPLENRQEITLSEQQKIISEGNWIFPIYTAIEPKDEDFNYKWYEFTPYEVGSSYLNAYVPTWAFGRQYKDGNSVPFSTFSSKEYGPEFSLGYMLGIFGSAFEANIEEITKMIQDQPLSYIEQIAVNIILKKLLKPVDEKRIFPAQTFNFTYGMQNSPIKNQESLILIDAGIDYNLPVAPVLRAERCVDVIFVMDASSDLTGAPELRKAEDYAKKNNLKFPTINYENIDKNSINIFSEKDKPTIIYMPLIKDNNLSNIKQIANLKDFDAANCIANGYASTFNCSYAKNEFDQLFQLMKFNVTENKMKIKNILNKIVDEK